MVRLKAQLGDHIRIKSRKGHLVAHDRHVATVRGTHKTMSDRLAYDTFCQQCRKYLKLRAEDFDVLD